MKPGDAFREWLIEIIGDDVNDKKGDVRVYKFSSASHTVCRYEFASDGYSVVGKFFAEPIGVFRKYDTVNAMENEFSILQAVSNLINVPRPIATKKEFNCVLITEYIEGNNLKTYMESEKDISEVLCSIAKILKKLHNLTESYYKKEIVFIEFGKILDQLVLDTPVRNKYNSLLENWQKLDLLDENRGCLIHKDATPPNCIINNNKKIYMLDFESSLNNANFVHDLGTMSAEIKLVFTLHKKLPEKGDLYIDHFLRSYSKNEKEYQRIVEILPIFISLGLLRMARLPISTIDRSYIIDEALRCLTLKKIG